VDRRRLRAVHWAAAGNAVTITALAAAGGLDRLSIGGGGEELPLSPLRLAVQVSLPGDAQSSRWVAGGR
jgi:hypothetical protein